jgi:hypothetical protein
MTHLAVNLTLRVAGQTGDREKIVAETGMRAGID